jgi:CRISPR-associated endonuclease/helicase Cas3
MAATDPKEYLAQVLELPPNQTPFPWQVRRLEEFLQGSIPEALDIPTGLGKTSVMAIWLLARAYGANLPRRLVYVVDRRAVVDQATEVALSLRAFVEKSPELKGKLGLNGRPLPISTLRGQFVDNREWLEDPAASAIIVGTVDMIGSRLLFEGYGVSRKMRPYHAGLLGVDALVVLDEAHLVPPFEHLLRDIAQEPSLRPRGAGCVPPFRLLALSATGRTQSSNIVGLTNQDDKHNIVKKRLKARKSLRIETRDTGAKLEEALAKHAWELSGQGTQAVRVLVYSDSRGIAQKAKEAVEKLAKDDKKQGKPETELFVGGRRVFEREEAKKRLESLGFIAGSTIKRSCPVFLFATSAGEVGVDLDADHMVCDLVPWERMVQRLGRVNRRGDGKANVIVIGRLEPDEKVRQAEEQRRKLRRQPGRLVGPEEARREQRGLAEDPPGRYNARAASSRTDAAARRSLVHDLPRRAHGPACHPAVVARLGRG